MVLIDFERHGILIRFVGTHEQYDATEDIEHISRMDLERYIAPRGSVSEVLNGKRNLTPPMIKRLHEGLKIPYESLIR